jgi:ABC-type maltose transport system permease subunit
MAAGVLAALPIVLLFAFTMRAFIAGLTAGAVKG